MTRLPGSVPPSTSKKADDVKALALVHGQDRDGDGVPDALRKPQRLPDEAISRLAGPRERVKGKLPMVFMIEEKIKKLMPQVEAAGLSKEARAEKARKAYDELAPFANGLRYKKMVPADVYRKMGLSDTYIEEETASTSTALDMLNETLKKLKKYE